MNSSERREQRYLRRKEKRMQKREVVRYDDCFTFSNLWKSARKSYNNVRWKTSVKNYERKMFSNVAHASYIMQQHKYKPKKTRQFIIHERGKERIIDSTPIDTRVIEKCFCDYGIVPLISKSLIYDNSATLKGKGTWFCVMRVKFHYATFMRIYPDGYVLIMDFHSYFASIDHELLYHFVRRYMDDDCFEFYRQNIEMMKGLNLGSQLSQISAVYFAYMFDEICQSLCYYYARYMDDSVMFFRSKQEMENAIPLIIKMIELFNLSVSKKKVKRVKASNGFTFLKKRFLFTNNKVIVYPYKENDRIVRRKMKRLKRAQVSNIQPYLNGALVAYKKTNAYSRYLSLIYDSNLRS